jgi:hypothetical protein
MDIRDTFIAADAALTAIAGGVQLEHLPLVMRPSRARAGQKPRHRGGCSRHLGEIPGQPAGRAGNRL